MTRSKLIGEIPVTMNRHHPIPYLVKRDAITSSRADQLDLWNTGFLYVLSPQI